MIFLQTLKTIELRNAEEKRTNPRADRAIHGITKYADWSDDEFRALLGYKKDADASASDAAPQLFAQRKHPSSGKDAKPGPIPCTVNWASRGQVRNQGKCGSCWTFATAEQLRSAYIQQHGKDPGVLSTQYLVDCMRQTTCNGGVNGCCGGNPYMAFKWIREQGGIPTQAAYGDVFTSFVQVRNTSFSQVNNASENGPVSNSGEGITYSGNNPTKALPCKPDIPKAVTMTANPTQFRSEDDMASYVCGTGSIAILVDASQWSTYTGGVMQASSCGSSVDHAVQLIGVNKSAGAWIVQNEWGADWGVALDGTTVPKDHYGNCAWLAKYGCSRRLQNGESIREACPVSCGESGPAPAGGYIYLAYGDNTCGIHTQPLSATSTAPATAHKDDSWW